MAAGIGRASGRLGVVVEPAPFGPSVSARITASVLSTAMSTRAAQPKGRAEVAVRSRVGRVFVFVVVLPAISLFRANSLYSQSRTPGSDPVVIAMATPALIYDRVRIELPRIMTWRPLPVVAPESRRHEHRAEPKAIHKSS